MKNINYEDIKIEYKYFIEYINQAHSTLLYLIEDTNKFLLNYCKRKKYNTDIVNNLEVNLIYFENFLLYIDNILEYIENINAIEKNIEKITDNKENNLYIFYPDYYFKNDDVYIDSLSKIDINIFKPPNNT